MGGGGGSSGGWCADGFDWLDLCGLMGGCDDSAFRWSYLHLTTPSNHPQTAVLEDFDYSFSENGLVAYKEGKLIGHTSINDHLGEENIKVGSCSCECVCAWVYFM
jgi:hypothetical protein